MEDWGLFLAGAAIGAAGAIALALVIAVWLSHHETCADLSDGD